MRVAILLAAYAGGFAPRIQRRAPVQRRAAEPPHTHRRHPRSGCPPRPHYCRTCKAIVLGASRSGKTYLLNQVLATKLPKGKGTTVGFGTVPVAIGASSKRAVPACGPDTRITETPARPAPEDSENILSAESLEGT